MKCPDCGGRLEIRDTMITDIDDKNARVEPAYWCVVCDSLAVLPPSLLRLQ